MSNKEGHQEPLLELCSTVGVAMPRGDGGRGIRGTERCVAFRGPREAWLPSRWRGSEEGGHRIEGECFKNPLGGLRPILSGGRGLADGVLHGSTTGRNEGGTRS